MLSFICNKLFVSSDDNVVNVHFSVKIVDNNNLLMETHAFNKKNAK